MTALRRHGHLPPVLVRHPYTHPNAHQRLATQERAAHLPRLTPATARLLLAWFDPSLHPYPSPLTPHP